MLFLGGPGLPWPHGHMHSRYRKGTAVLPTWFHEGMVRHGPGTRGSIQMWYAIAMMFLSSNKEHVSCINVLHCMPMRECDGVLPELLNL